ncbi:MAG: NUDIX hydrolase [Pseudomonadota bacterium]
MDKSDCTIHVGVGAVVFKGDDVLIIKRGKAPFKGAWSIPGGRLEYGETVRDAVTREVREETAIEIRIIDLLDVFDATPEARGDAFDNHTVIIDYVATWVAGVPVAGDDAIEAEFVSFDEAIARLSWDKTREALTKARAIRDAAHGRLGAIKSL